LPELQALWQDHQVTSLNRLADACQQHQLRSWKILDSRGETRLLATVRERLQRVADYLLQPAQAIALTWQKNLADMPSVHRFELTGQIRRGNELIRTVDFLLAADVAAFKNDLQELYQLTPQGDEPMFVKEINSPPVRFWLTRPETFVRHQLLLTGGDRYLKHLKQVLEQENLTPETLTEARQEDFPENTEADLCHKLGIRWLAPELRDTFHDIPEDLQLLRPDDIKGILHVHSTWSDGRDSLETMVRAARDLGYAYLGVSDHSQAAHYARGLSPEQVRQQWDRIDELNLSYRPFRIFKGIEADILKDGRLDYTEDLLAGFDFVIASIHSYFHLSPEEQTNRLIRALRSPFTTILGHPTGRMLLAREGYHPDLNVVLAVAAEEHKVIELNSTPKRLDLDWRYLDRARELGIRIAIDPDAHNVHGLTSIPQGVMMARKGGLAAGNVLNTLNAMEISRFFTEQKKW